MTQNKDLKRLVRARMKKTGEAYTAARAQIVKKGRTTTRAAANTAPAEPASAPRPDAAFAPHPADYAALAGTSERTMKEKTGCTWDKWVYALDRRGANTMSHGEIAALVRTKYKIDGWWAQAVTVGYERIKGLRARGQQRDGTFGATKSRTFNVPVTELFDAWANADVRRRWLKAGVKVRTATSPKSIRLDWAEGGIIAVGFTAKGKAKSIVALEHTKLRDRETAAKFKEYWSERLDALEELLAER
jgi:uncharacterized protein YndB with AHSA1/START domain